MELALFFKQFDSISVKSSCTNGCSCLLATEHGNNFYLSKLMILLVNQTRRIWDEAKRIASQVAQWQESTCQCRRQCRRRFNPWVRNVLWRRKWQTTPVFLPGEFHGLGSLVGYGPWGCKESVVNERPTHAI